MQRSKIIVQTVPKSKLDFFSKCTTSGVAALIAPYEIAELLGSILKQQRKRRFIDSAHIRRLRETRITWDQF